MRIVLFVILFIGFAFSSFSQKTFQPKQTDFNWKGIVYRNEVSVDFRIHTNGAAVAVNFGKILTYYKTKYYQIELGYMKDFRERKQNKNLAFEGLGTSNSFVYGKQNNMIVLRGGVGYKRFLSEKARRKGIAVGYNYEFGPSIAILKPYYLDVVRYTEVDGTLMFGIESEKLTADNRDSFLDYESIYGGSGFGKGIGELSFIPGAQAKLGLLLSMGAYDKMVKAAEIGIMADVYTKKVPIMVETETVSNKPYFINFYIHLQLGRRSN